MKASVKGRYATEKSSAAATLTVNAGDVKLRASMTDATLVTGPSLSGLSLSIDKPGAFMIDYNVPKKLSASVGLADEVIVPKLSAESVWDFEM